MTATRGLRLALAVMAGLAGSAGWTQATPFVSPPTDNAAELSRNLTLLGSNPNSIAALTGAGRAALALDDPEAAVTFLGRAEELAPRDGRIKADIGTAFVMMEQPTTALRFFEEATRLGVPVMQLAGDRGLAYDLLGNPARAQQDYQMSLARVDHPEVRRRLALSLAISGNRAGALAAIDQQLRRQDRAAWRARAFILALTGDAQGATAAVQAAMPGQAQAMAPFLARLPSLSAADRARAVHFGHFPGDAPPQLVDATPFAPAPAPSRPDPATFAGRPDNGQRPLGVTPPVPNGPVPNRTAPAGQGPVQRPGQGRRVEVSIPQSASPQQPSSSGPIAVAQAPAPPQTVSLPAQGGEPPVLVQVTPAQPAAAPVIAPDTAPTDAAAATALPAPTDDADALADLASLIDSLSDPVASPKPPQAAPARAKPATKPAPSGRPAAKPVPPAAREPRRIWVQIAGGASEAAFPAEFRRLKSKAPKLFAGRTAWTASLRATNRLLVGPFKTNQEAQDFVNQLARADLNGFSWTSASGQEIKKLPAK